jgi:hypothetical protein
MSKIVSTNQRQSAARTKLQFHGSLTELQDLILLTGDNGEWEEQPNGVWHYRSEDGGGLNWSSTRGTIWFDGPDPSLLRRIMVEAIRASIYRRRC